MLSFKNQLKNLIITAKNNQNAYFKKFKYFLDRKNSNKITLLNNLNLNVMERLINYSVYSISCHSGFLVQISGCNKTNIIDIINKKDYIWYSCWKPLNTGHKFVYKSNFNNKLRLKSIFKQIINASTSFK